MADRKNQGLAKRVRAAEEAANVDLAAAYLPTLPTSDRLALPKRLDALERARELDGSTITPGDDPVLATGGQLAYTATPWTAGKIVTIPNGDATNSVYTFVASVANPGDVLNDGADPDVTAAKLVNAINASGGTPGVGGDYIPAGGLGVAHPLVSAALTGGASPLVFTVLTPGTIGNIDITTDEAQITPTDPSGGLNNTNGSQSASVGAPLIVNTRQGVENRLRDIEAAE